LQEKYFYFAQHSENVQTIQMRETLGTDHTNIGGWRGFGASLNLALYAINKKN